VTRLRREVASSDPKSKHAAGVARVKTPEPATPEAPPFVQITVAYEARTRLFGLAQDGTVWEYIVGKYSTDPSGWRQLSTLALAQTSSTPLTPWGLR